MGTTTDAILCYGVQLAEGALSGLWEEGDEWPTAPGPAYVAHMAWLGSVSDGCSVLSHSSDDYEEHIVVVHPTVLRAHRGYPVRIGGDLRNTPEMSRLVLDFVEKHGLAAESSEPGWLLASWWG